MVNSEQIHPLLAFSAGVPAQTFFERTGVVLPSTGAVLTAFPLARGAPKIRRRIVSNPKPLILSEGIGDALIELPGRSTIPVVLPCLSKQQNQLLERKTSSAALSVPIRNDPEMVVKLGLHAIEAGLQRQGAAA